MRIIDIRPDHREEDLEAAISTIETEIGHPSKSVMVIVGESHDITRFVDRAGTRSDPFPWREALWLKLSPVEAQEVLGDDRYRAWFPEPGVCAVVLDFEDNLVARLDATASLFEIEDAFLQARG